jgi:erythrocyte band 7 integral membrane protein
VENSQESTRLLAQTSLRNVLGTISLAELLSNREAVSCRMREILDEATDQYIYIFFYFNAIVALSALF